MRNRRPRVIARAPARLALAALALLVADTAASADHRDGPLFENTAVNGRADIGDLYVFRGPSATTNTVFILTVSPFAGNLTPKTFDATLAYEIKIDRTGDAVEDLTFQVTFGPPDGNDIQDVILRALPSADFPNDGILARAKTGQNVSPLPGGGVGRARRVEPAQAVRQRGEGQLRVRRRLRGHADGVREVAPARGADPLDHAARHAAPALLATRSPHRPAIRLLP